MANPPAPTRLKVLRGTTRPDRSNPREPKPKALPASAKPPAWISKAARPYWPDFAEMFNAAGLLTVLDKASLVLLVDALAEYIRCRDDESTPYAAMYSSWRRLHVMLGDFGASPASRAKVTAILGEGDEVDAWLAGKNSG